MFCRITTDLTTEELVEKLDEEKMVNINEWDPVIWGCYREEIVSYSDIDKSTLELMDNYWIGVPLGALDIAVSYEVYLHGGVLEFCFLDYSTYTSGFLQPILFDIIDWSKAIKDILYEWEAVLGSNVEDIDMDPDIY